MKITSEQSAEFEYVPIRLFRQLDNLCDRHGIKDLPEGFCKELVGLIACRERDARREGYNDGYRDAPCCCCCQGVKP